MAENNNYPEEPAESPEPERPKSSEETATKVLVRKRVMAQETYDYVVRTLAGLMDMESISGRLEGQRLVVKLVEKTYDSKNDVHNKSVSYIYGKMEQTAAKDACGDAKKWGFAPEADEEGGADAVLLTFSIVVDEGGKKTTRVTVSPRVDDAICTTCSKRFKTAAHLRRHVVAYHNGEKRIACKLCPRSFADYRSMMRHHKGHGGGGAAERWFECPRCGKPFGSQFGLRRHLSVHDANLRPLQCNVCEQRFAEQSALKKHLAGHARIRAFQCPRCMKSFVSRGDLNYHARVHDPLKHYVCEVCGRHFSRYANLIRHGEIHKGSGDLFTCEMCGCSYNFISSLTRHIVQSHIERPAADASD